MRPPQLDDEEGAPDWWRRSKSLRVAPVVLVIVLVAIFVHASQTTPPPALRTSCTTPALALSARSVGQHRPVRWSATGPAGMRFLVALGVARFDVDPRGQLQPVPDAGLARAATQAASRDETMPAGCTTDDVFATIVPPGSYTVRMFRLNPPGRPAAATPVAAVPLTVTPRKG